MALCECGCGQETRIPLRDLPRCGWVAGVPLRFINGHNGRFNEAQRREAFWKKTEEIGLTGCIEWTGTISKWGYGHFWTGKRFIMSHRYAYQVRRGEIPKGMDLDHLCRNRRCVNPNHLEVVTRAENLRRGARTKLNLEKVLEIRSSSERAKDLAEKFGVDASTISDIRHGNLWKDVVNG